MRGSRLNHKIIATVTVTLIAIVTAIVLLIYYNIISLEFGIIYGTLTVIVTTILETVIPVIINYSIAPKVSLKVDNIQLEKKTYQNVEGYLLTALVTNKGKKIAFNLDATVQIKNEQNEVPKLLNVAITEQNGNVISAQASEEVFDNKKYAWIYDKDNKFPGFWAQLREGDHVNLLFPYELHLGATSIGSPVVFYGETLLNLQKNISYEVIIEVKGENAEKTTERGKVRKNISLT